MPSVKKHILIAGAGFGGVQAARCIARLLIREKLTDYAEVSLVDRNHYHTFTPTLYEAATTTDLIASNADLQHIITLPLKEIIAELPIHSITAPITHIDIANQELRLASGTALAYDYLVLALGSEPNYYDIPGLADYALPLKTFTDALHIRERIIEHVENTNRPGVNIVIGGGGPTGVELAGEIKNLLHELPRVADGECADRVTIIDGGATILSAFDKRISSAAQKRLSYLEVETISQSRILEATATDVILNNAKRVPHDLLIWTGGIIAHQLMRTLPLLRDQSGKRILADMHGRCTPTIPHPEKAVYGIGDAVCYLDEKTGQPVPSVAPAAIEQAQIVAHNIIQNIKQKQTPTYTAREKAYIARNYPYILPVGGKFAIAKFGPIVIAGFSAWVLKGLVELNYFKSVFTPLRALRYWLGGLWIFLRNDRLG